jgi:hypothetical protein
VAGVLDDVLADHRPVGQAHLGRGAGLVVERGASGFDDERAIQALLGVLGGLGEAGDVADADGSVGVPAVGAGLAGRHRGGPVVAGGDAEIAAGGVGGHHAGVDADGFVEPVGELDLDRLAGGGAHDERRGFGLVVGDRVGLLGGHEHLARVGGVGAFVERDVGLERGDLEGRSTCWGICPVDQSSFVGNGCRSRWASSWTRIRPQAPFANFSGCVM